MLVDFAKDLLVVNPTVAFLDPILRLHLNHFSTLTNQIKASAHHFRPLPLNCVESLELNEAYIFDGAFYWHVDNSRHFGQDG